MPRGLTEAEFEEIKKFGGGVAGEARIPYDLGVYPPVRGTADEKAITRPGAMTYSMGQPSMRL